MSGDKNPKRYSPEFKEEAAKMVVNFSRPIAQVARELGISKSQSYRLRERAVAMGLMGGKANDGVN